MHLKSVKCLEYFQKLIDCGYNELIFLVIVFEFYLVGYVLLFCDYLVSHRYKGGQNETELCTI